MQRGARGEGAAGGITMRYQSEHERGYDMGSRGNVEEYRGRGTRGWRDEGGQEFRGSMQRYEPQWRGGRQDDRIEREDASDAVVKVIEVLAQSERGWEDAAQRAVEEASRSVRNIRSIYIKDMQAVVRDGRITQYRITAKLSFVLDGHREHERDYEGRGPRS